MSQSQIEIKRSRFNKPAESKASKKLDNFFRGRVTLKELRMIDVTSETEGGNRLAFPFHFSINKDMHC